MTEPARPPALPAEAAFDPERSRWQLAERNAAGVLHGAFATYRASGRPLTRGSYVEGKPEGTWSRFTDDAPDAEALRACCVPPGARELRSRYRAGMMLDETFYDERGRPLCDDGTPWPERHASLPATASYEQTSARFVDQLDREDNVVTLRYFKLDGVLDEEFDVKAGRKLARRRFGPGNHCIEETSFDERGLKHGPYLARFPGGQGPYLGDLVHELRGQHEHDEPVGTWKLVGATGAPVRLVQHGTELDQAALARVAGADEQNVPTADELWARAAAASEASPRESIAFAARALAKSGDLQAFERFLAARVAPLHPALAKARADAAAGAEGASPSSLLASLLGGAAPAIIFRTLASLLPGHAPAALDYFDASLLLAPDQPMAALARGLLCVEHGQPDGALAAAELVTRDAADAGQFLLNFARITYQGFPFAPTQHGLDAPEEELVPLAAEQPLEAVRRAVGVYATRLALLRTELVRRSRGTPGWLPPDTTALLPDGPLELRRYTAQIEDEGEQGSELTEVEIDETPALGESTRRLLITARSDWAALGWLCWCAGLDQIALPERLQPRPEFAAAAHQATLRCWRAHDRVKMGGLVALARNVRSFEWEGMPIDSVPSHLIEVAAAEYLEVRAQFLWLLFPQNSSPFQSDLRRV